MIEDSHRANGVSRARLLVGVLIAIVLIPVVPAGLYVYMMSSRHELVLRSSTIVHRADAAELGGRSDEEVVAFALRAVRQVGIDDPSLTAVPSRASTTGALVFRYAAQANRFTVEFVNDRKDDVQLDIEIVGGRAECVMTGSLVTRQLAKKAAR